MKNQEQRRLKEEEDVSNRRKGNTESDNCQLDTQQGEGDIEMTITSSFSIGENKIMPPSSLWLLYYLLYLLGVAKGHMEAR